MQQVGPRLNYGL
jgi:uncharacterized protein YpmS